MQPLRLLVYDDTCRGRTLLPGLTHSWIAGAALYTGLDRLDRVYAAHEWPAALEWLATVADDRPIGEIQFWGHGKWGRALVDDDVLDASALDSDHALHDRLLRIRDRLADDALWWFRTCETFGADAGHDFARRWSDFFGCRAASHTYIIGPWQSGLHIIRPGHRPDWPADEGLAEGTPANPERAIWSKPTEPRTITCLASAIPNSFVDDRPA